MRIDLPQCGFHYCRFQFDGNCTSTKKYEKCEYRYLSEQIEPERKKGKWIYYDPNGFKCSECGGYLEIGGGDVKMNFCSNCGADMR